MHLSQTAKSRIITFAIFIAPLVVVQLASLMLGASGPAHAQADEPVPVQDSVALPANQKPSAPTEHEFQAGRRAAELRSLPFGPSPLYYASQKTVVIEPVHVPADLNAPPSFRVNGIFVTSTVITAIIDGKVYKLGDHLGESSWVISDIDNNKRTISIYDSKTNRTISQSVDTSH